ncbi:helix-turn-helix domain-containing protein [Kineosporia babensis]|uniref:Helix-turn-helix transcriptional regulator n=1 Tax=Kineosporia babensis TaxID=499548 RepID=A0A9X1NMX9_9ACTN|nr:helix-turn-helix transcriptional regulator [Kineosporia babensis]MCD5316038.1 helix-turn-helix transcriptional regulator [Kineosporia babensis]
MGSPPAVQTELRRRVREFLSTRRARLTPLQAGLPVTGGRRRVQGLRREEVAALAGISVEYYIRLERGDASNVSDAVLDGIGRALQLSAAEHAHLLGLLRAGTTAVCAPAAPPAQLRAPVQRILDSMTTTPALVHDGRLNVLGSNALGKALFEAMTGTNLARFTFLDPAARTFWADWDTVADDTVNRLLTAAGARPCDAARTGLVSELSSASAEFRERWARHDVCVHSSGVTRLLHPLVGELELAFESTTLDSDPGQTLLMYTAEPGSSAEDGLKLLASWSAVMQR